MLIKMIISVIINPSFRRRQHAINNSVFEKCARFISPHQYVSFQFLLINVRSFFTYEKKEKNDSRPLKYFNTESKWLKLFSSVFFELSQEMLLKKSGLHHTIRNRAFPPYPLAKSIHSLSTLFIKSKIKLIRVILRHKQITDGWRKIKNGNAGENIYRSQPESNFSFS